MGLKTIKKELTFKGVEIDIETEAYICPECGLEAGTLQSAGALQLAIADAYRTKQNLLISTEIKEFRKSHNLTQALLADSMNVGIASIKRLESSTVQSASMDRALQMHFQGLSPAENYFGNREISLPRIKLVARQLEKLSGRKLLKKNRINFYIWLNISRYADFVCFRQTGRGLTGASYAAITYGPQLNNYRDLVDPIRESDENQAETLTDMELKILKQVIEKFPEEQIVYDAAHREKVWQETRTGALISYTRAHELTEI